MGVIGQLKDCYCKLADRVTTLENAVDEDDQQLSLSGNILTLEDGGTVDLTPFLDNTDDQTITAFNLSPAGVLTLTIEDGNTVTVDLSTLDTDTDDQTLSLAGTLLSIADGNTVDLSAINTDNQTLSTITGGDGETTFLSISGGNQVPITHPPDPGLNVTAVNRLNALGHVSVNIGSTTVNSASGGAAGIRTGVGQWNLIPPTGAVIALASIIEDRATRDDIVIHLENALGTQITMSEQDNGAGAGTVTDNGFNIVWFGPEVVVTSVALT